jgi:hypothetical protein
MDTVSHANMVQFNIWDFVQTIVAHAVAFTFVKISIAVSLLRLSQSRVFQWVIWPIIAVFLASLIVAFFAFFMRCIPLRAVFDTDIEGNCYPVEQFVQMALANTGGCLWGRGLCVEWGGRRADDSENKRNEHCHRCALRDAAHPHHLEPADAAADAPVPDRHLQHGLSVGSRPHIASFFGYLFLTLLRAVAMGILKAYYQINFTKTPDLTWSYPISFWGL